MVILAIVFGPSSDNELVLGSFASKSEQNYSGLSPDYFRLYHFLFIYLFIYLFKFQSLKCRGLGLVNDNSTTYRYRQLRSLYFALI